MQAQTSPSSGKSGLKVVFFVLFIIAAIGVLAYLINHYFLQKQVALKNPMTILLIGEDSGTSMNAESGAASRSDALVLMFLDPARSKISLISIPNNCQVNIPGAGPGPINEAGAKGGALAVQQALEALTNSRINRYLTINYEGFKSLVDMIGGVEVQVTSKMYYMDRKGTYITGFEPGPEMLDGEEALLYVRYRDQATGEVGRIKRQQEFIKVLAQKTFHSGNIVDLVKLYNVFKQYTKTDLSAVEILQVSKFLQNIKPDQNLDAYTLPGHSVQTVWQPDLVELDKLMVRVDPLRGNEADLK